MNLGTLCCAGRVPTSPAAAPALAVVSAPAIAATYETSAPGVTVNPPTTRKKLCWWCLLVLVLLVLLVCRLSYLTGEGR